MVKLLRAVTPAKINLFLRVTGRRQRRLDRVGRPVIGGLFRLLAGRADRRLAKEKPENARLRELAERARDELAAAERELDAATRDLPIVRAALSTVDIAVRHRTETAMAAVAAAGACRAALAAVAAPPPVRTGTDPRIEHDDLRQLSAWLHGNLPVLLARAGLLTAWHAEASGETSQLYPELIRYADVVAASRRAPTWSTPIETRCQTAPRA